MTGRLFSLGLPVWSFNKTDRLEITEIWLKVALNTLILILTILEYNRQYLLMHARINPVNLAFSLSIRCRIHKIHNTTVASCDNPSSMIKALVASIYAEKKM